MGQQARQNMVGQLRSWSGAPRLEANNTRPQSVRLLCAAFRYPFSCGKIPSETFLCAVQAEVLEASKIVSVCSWRVTRGYLGSMLWFSPSWIDQILNLLTALPLVAQIRSSHLNYRRRSDSARGVQNDRTEQARSGYKPAAVSISAKQFLPQIASACGAAHSQRSEAIHPPRLQSARLPLSTSAPCNLDPISQNSSTPEPAVAPGDRSGEFCVSLRAV